MANCTDTLTTTVLGNNTFVMPVTFTPNKLRLEVGSKNSSTTATQLSLGTVDSGGYMTCISQSTDNSTSTRKNFNGQSKVISIWEYVSGTWTEVVAATFVGFTSTGFTLNFTAVSSSYNIKYFAEN